MDDVPEAEVELRSNGLVGVANGPSSSSSRECLVGIGGGDLEYSGPPKA